MTTITWGEDWSLAVAIHGENVVLTVRTPTRDDGIPFRMTPTKARRLAVALAACARVVDPESAEHLRLVAELAARSYPPEGGGEHA